MSHLTEIEKRRLVYLSMMLSKKTQVPIIHLDQQLLVYHVVNITFYMDRNGSTMEMLKVLKVPTETMKALRNSSKRGGNLNMLLA